MNAYVSGRTGTGHGAHISESCRLPASRIWQSSSSSSLVSGLQLAAAVPAAIAVIIPDHYADVLYWLAVISAILLMLWWIVNGRYTRARNGAQGARRGALLLGGLNEQLSPGEVQALRERFTVSAAEAQKFERADYYATTLP